MHTLYRSPGISLTGMLLGMTLFVFALTASPTHGQCAPTPPAAPPMAEVTMTDDRYTPVELVVPAGATVRWSNFGQHPHTVTTDTANAATGGPDSGQVFPNGVPPNAAVVWTVPVNAASGTRWYYHCVFHGGAGDGKSLGPGMSGVIVVQ